MVGADHRHRWTITDRADGAAAVFAPLPIVEVKWKSNQSHPLTLTTISQAPGVELETVQPRLQRKCATRGRMKTSTIPSVRVEPELRKQLEQVLQAGETLS